LLWPFQAGDTAFKRGQARGNSGHLRSTIPQIGLVLATQLTQPDLLHQGWLAEGHQRQCGTTEGSSGRTYQNGK
jgi:hypothetical protein